MIKKFVSFLGPVRSGHTLISSLLSVHPKIAISLELQPIKRLYRNFLTRKEVIDRILNNCKNRKRMEMGGYEYSFSKVQNKVEGVEIIGDSIAGLKQATSVNKNTINKFCKVMKIPTAWIIVYRNPFDIITSAHFMNKKSIARNVDYYIEITELTIRATKLEQIKNNLFKFHMESFIKEPKKWLKKICDFLEVEATPEYLEFCSSKVFKKPKRTFDKTLWNKSEINKINKFIQSVPELERYHNAF